MWARNSWYIFKHVVTFFVVVLPANLIGIPLLAVTLLFYIKDKRILSESIVDQRLPKLLQIWDNGDEWDRNCGLNGDVHYQFEFLTGAKASGERLQVIINAVRLLYDPNDEIDGNPVPWWKIYLMRFNWLALRNPTNALGRRILGFKSDTITEVTKFINIVDGEQTTEKEVGNWFNAGYRHIEVKTSDGKTYREYYIIKKIPMVSSKVLRIRIGHKLDHKLHSDIHANEYKPYVSWVLVIQLKDYNGQ